MLCSFLHGHVFVVPLMSLSALSTFTFEHLFVLMIKSYSLDLVSRVGLLGISFFLNMKFKKPNTFIVNVCYVYLFYVF